jgi:hypothetical protein
MMLGNYVNEDDFFDDFADYDGCCTDVEDHYYYD